MKKLFQMGIAMLSVLVFSACTSDDTMSKRAEGKYTVERETNMVGLPVGVPFTPITNTVQLNVKAVADYFVNITLPSTSYNYMGQEMTIQEVVIKNIPVIDDLENGVSIPKHTFKQEDGKYIEGTISGEIEADGDVDLTIQYKYGSMPFQIKQEFETIG